MRLEVTGIETIELSDPKGLCNRPAVVPVPMPSNPSNPWPAPVTPVTPLIPFGDAPPGCGIVGSTDDDASYYPYPGDPLPQPHIWSKALPTTVSHKDRDYHEKWGKGLPEGEEPPKWVKNWQSNMSQ